MSLNNKPVTIAVFLVAIAGVMILLAATKFGIGVAPDSTVYLGAASNLLKGLGLTALDGTTADLKLMTHYPPLYSALLAAIGMSGMSIESAARWLNVFLLGANAALVAYAIRMLKPASMILPVLGAILVVTAPDVLTAHSFALTEPLFIFFTLIGAIFFIRYGREPQYSYLTGAAIAIALSGLTRYIGGASMLAGVVLIFLVKGRSVLEKARDSVLFGAVAFVPSALWAMRNILAAKESTDRRIVFHPMPLEQLAAGASTVAKWFMVGRLSGTAGTLISILILAALLGSVLYVFLRNRENISLKEGAIPLLLISAYIGFLIFTASFVDADTVFDGRSLGPVHILAIVLILCWAGSVYTSSTSRLLRIVLAVFAAGIIISYGIRSSNWFSDVSSDGQLYSARAWTGSPTLLKVRELSADAPIYSNGYEAVYYITGRRAAYLPEKTDHRTRVPNANFETDIERIRNDLADHGGYLVYFNTLDWKPFMPTEDELKTSMNLKLVAAESDGAIYMAEKR